MAQGSEEPPFLTVGTEVSAKYRGAFCEASIKTIKKLVKCKIQYKNNTTGTVNDDGVKGALKVGSVVEVKNSDGQLVDGVITKLTDASVYTVVFDDGDERTLRRTSLCLKGERHFNESETLDHLPLTDPENFGTPVVQNGKKRKKRRLSQQSASIDDSENEAESPAPVVKKKCLFNDSIVGKVVVVERGTKRKSHWFPALGVSPSSDNMEFIKSKDHCLARSFKDGNYHIVNVRDTKDFSKDEEPVSTAIRTENRVTKAAIDRAIAYLETGRIPSIWEGNKSEVIMKDEDTGKAKLEKQSSEEGSEDDEDEKKEFMTKLNAFMDDRRTPITRPPVLGNQDLDLYKLYVLVQEFGGMEEVTNQQQWRNLYSKMGIAIMPPSASHHIKMAYKKYLQPYEEHQLGKPNQEPDEENVDSSTRERNTSMRGKPTEDEKTEAPHPRERSSSRTRLDRSMKNSKPDKPATPDKPDKRVKPVSTPESKPAGPKKPDKLILPDRSSPSGKPSRVPTPSKATPSKRATTPNNKGKPNSKPSTPNQPPTPDSSDDLSVDKRDASRRRGEDESSSHHDESIDSEVDIDDEVTSPESELAVDVVNSPGSLSDISESRSDYCPEDPKDYNVGDKIQVKYGRGRNQLIYEAKITTIDENAEEGILFLIHYAGWNNRYDEWISPDRVVGKSTCQSRKKGTFMVRGIEVARPKFPPKPMGRNLQKAMHKKWKLIPPNSGAGKASNGKNAPTNGNKAPTRSASPSVTSAASPGTVSRRTRSERNSLPESANGTSEGDALSSGRSPPTKRQQKSVTPEPTDCDKAEEVKPLVPIPDKKPSLEENVVKSFDQAFEKEDAPLTCSKKEDKEVIVPDPQEPTSNDNEHEKKEPEKPKEQGGRKKSRRVLNGLIRSLSSPASMNSDYSLQEDDPDAPPVKKVKVEEEKDLEDIKIEKLLGENVPSETPAAAPHSEGSTSADADKFCSMNGRIEEQQPQEGVEENKSESENNQKDNSQSSSPNGSTSSSKDECESTKEKPEKHTSRPRHDSKSDKKNSDDKHRRHRRRREKKKQRHHSGNDSTGSDIPASPGIANSPASRPSPSRPRINFDAELVMIKANKDSSERIRLLQEKIKEMRKLYGSLKAEVATIDRRRKRLKKKREEHEADSALQESNHKSSSCVSPTPPQVECR